MCTVQCYDLGNDWLLSEKFGSCGHQISTHVRRTVGVIEDSSLLDWMIKIL